MKKISLILLTIGFLSAAEEARVDRHQYLVHLGADIVKTVKNNGQFELPIYKEEKNAHLIMRVECVPAKKKGIWFSRVWHRQPSPTILPGGHIKTVTEYFFVDGNPPEGTLVENVLRPPAGGYPVASQTKLAIQWACAQKEEGVDWAALKQEVVRNYTNQGIHADISLVSPPSFWEAYCRDSAQIKARIKDEQAEENKVTDFISLLALPFVMVGVLSKW